MTMYRSLTVVWLCAAAAGLAACDTEDPTVAVVENTYAPAADGPSVADAPTVYKAWWVTTLFADPIAPGATSEEERTVPGTDFVYALLAPGWDPLSATMPATLWAMKSKAKVEVSRGGTLRIAISDQTFDGNCAARQPLSQDDADFVTRRIFPGEFARAIYDAATCAALTLPLPFDGDAAQPAADRDAVADVQEREANEAGAARDAVDD